MMQKEKAVEKISDVMRLLNLTVIIAVVFICFSFFMPWVAGKGSLTGPIDAISGFLGQEPTGIVGALSDTASGGIDIITQTISPIDLDRQLAGHKLPVASETEGLRPQIYLLYLLPLAAVLCAVLGASSNKVKISIAFLISAAIFILMAGEISTLNQEGVFVEIQARDGFWYTLFACLGLSLSLLLKLFARSKAVKRSKNKYTTNTK